MSGYTARHIDVLEGMEAVRRRPGMYIGGTGEDGLHHLLWEIVDNAVDEAMNGHASRIDVILHRDGSASVHDNGRGIPVDLHPKLKKSALEVILTTLHAGGKFSKATYKTSGGLHGVGASAVNALSSSLDVEVRRDGRCWRQSYRRGRPLAPVAEAGPGRGTGTRIRFRPDTQIFGDARFDVERVAEQLEIKAYLNRGLTLSFRAEETGESRSICHEGGLTDFLASLLSEEDRRPLFDSPFRCEREDEIAFDLALTWTGQGPELLRSYVNGIPTIDGGTHVQGLRDGLAKGLRGYLATHELVPRGVSLNAEDLREGMVAVLSVLHPDPQFQGQTKGRLNNPEARSAIDGVLRPALEQWLHANPSLGQAIAERVIEAARARQAARQAAAAVRKKGRASRLKLPGKLADCSSREAQDSEIFLVEGDSAGGSAKQGRDRKTQAILPLRGKILNTEQASLKKVLANEELRNIVTALGCGMGRDCDVDRLRYQRVILLMDADSDGHHITTLLLTFFYRHLRALLKAGVVYLAQPPLFRIVAGKKTWWAKDERDRKRIVARLPARSKPEITRFKGLGEMPPATLFATTLDPARRRLLQVEVADTAGAEQAIVELMGRESIHRFRLIMDGAESVDDLDV